MRFPHWSLPRVGTSGEKRRFIIPGLLGTGDTIGKGVRLTRKTRPGISVHRILDQEHPKTRPSVISHGTQRQGDGKDCATLPPEWRGEVGVPRNLFPRLGVG